MPGITVCRNGLSNRLLIILILERKSLEFIRDLCAGRCVSSQYIIHCHQGVNISLFREEYDLIRAEVAQMDLPSVTRHLRLNDFEDLSSELN